jgi:hypothetical protein
MAHELAQWRGDWSDPPQLYGRYIKTQVDSDGWWDEAVVAFTVLRANYRNGQFHSDSVDGSKVTAEKLIDYMCQHGTEILAEIGVMQDGTETQA